MRRTLAAVLMALTSCGGSAAGTDGGFISEPFFGDEIALRPCAPVPLPPQDVSCAGFADGTFMAATFTIAPTDEEIFRLGGLAYELCLSREDAACGAAGIAQGCYPVGGGDGTGGYCDSPVQGPTATGTVTVNCALSKPTIDSAPCYADTVRADGCRDSLCCQDCGFSE